MNYPTLVLLTLGIAAIVAAGCTTTSPVTPQNITASPSGVVIVAIHPDITHYTVFMSSAPGIGLSPVVSGPVPAGNLTYVWKTDYGHFISWNAPDYTVQELGATATGSGTKVYWTFMDENGSVSRPLVHITLTVIDPATGATLGNAEEIIGWDANDTAVIG
ncbi:hypothetical protein [Methanoregula sp.]|uniref:hypothetical protein n=1 Tax=Methanoregula sp. TaxID=2052170 RepID=UPI002BFA1B8F|nr:hypothetical protein [Methanoregula sp.]HVP97066.1 hypothetical protein [Methanoregula sp.]